MRAPDYSPNSVRVVVLAASAGEERLNDLIQLLSIQEMGPSRIFFRGPIRKLGGERGRMLIEPFTSDPTLGPEATVLLDRIAGSRS